MTQLLLPLAPQRVRCSECAGLPCCCGDAPFDLEPEPERGFLADVEVIRHPAFMDVPQVLAGTCRRRVLPGEGVRW